MHATSLNIPTNIITIIFIITTTAATGPGPNQICHNTASCECVTAWRVLILQVRVHSPRDLHYLWSFG